MVGNTLNKGGNDMRKKCKVFTVAMFCLCMVVPKMMFAADSRDYIPAPPGTFLMVNYFKHIFANNLYRNGRKESNDFNLNMNLGIIRPVYFVKIGPFVFDPQAIIPFGVANLDFGDDEWSSTGWGDPMITATWWIVNDPAKKFWVGFTPFISLPLGSYDRHKPINLGANRWMFRPEVGVVKGFGERAYLDLILGGEFYTDNKDAGMGAAKVTLEQDPSLVFEAHASYDLTKKCYASLDYTYNYGGETTLDNVKQHNSLSNHGLGLSIFYMIGDNDQLMLQFKDDFSVNSGPGTSTLGLRWTHIF